MNTLKMNFDNEEEKDPFTEPGEKVADENDELSDDADSKKPEEEEEEQLI